ncbi:hypothetical protein, partial [Dysgonomonas gadei]|uniref:hypothetical protein n=1 Tax=Dysgonomonas gadei TaxID=156974 RepID=UPI003AF1D22A
DNPVKDDSVLFCSTAVAVLGRRRDAALIFCFVLHQGKMKNKPIGALDKIEQYYSTIIALTTDWHK